MFADEQIQVPFHYNFKTGQSAYNDYYDQLSLTTCNQTVSNFPPEEAAVLLEGQASPCISDILSIVYPKSLQIHLTTRPALALQPKTETWFTMARTPQDVTEAELSILQRLWDVQSATVRQLVDKLHPDGGSSEYATIQKLLERLQSKNYVVRNRDVWPHVFEATVGRDELIGRRLQTTADQLCDGSLQPLITSLVRSKKLSSEELQSLRDHLNELSDD